MGTQKTVKWCAAVGCDRPVLTRGIYARAVAILKDKLCRKHYLESLDRKVAIGPF